MLLANALFECSRIIHRHRGQAVENPDDQRHATRAVVVVGFYRFVVCRQYRYEPDRIIEAW
jgi:hypothetical protein